MLFMNFNLQNNMEKEIWNCPLGGPFGSTTLINIIKLCAYFASGNIRGLTLLLNHKIQKYFKDFPPIKETE